MKSLRIAALLSLLCGGMALAADQPAAEKHPKELSLDCGNGVTLNSVLIPAREFLMGNSDPMLSWRESWVSWFVDSREFKNKQPMRRPNDEGHFVLKPTR